MIRSGSTSEHGGNAGVSAKQEDKKQSGFFSRFTKSFWDYADPQIPPPSNNPQSEQGVAGNKSITGGDSGVRAPKIDTEVKEQPANPKMSEEMMRRSLKQAINSCKSNNSAKISNAPDVEHIASSYCDVKPEFDLESAGKIADIQVTSYI